MDFTNEDVEHIVNAFNNYLSGSFCDEDLYIIETVSKKNYSYLRKIRGVLDNSNKIYEEKEILAPFTAEQVETLNKSQTSGSSHPFTCCSPGDINKCMRRNGTSEGKLIATEEGWICPCGEYKQDWAWSFMATDQTKK